MRWYANKATAGVLYGVSTQTSALIGAEIAFAGLTYRPSRRTTDNSEKIPAASCSLLGSGDSIVPANFARNTLLPFHPGGRLDREQERSTRCARALLARAMASTL